MRNSVKLAIILLGFGQLPSIGHALNGFDLSETTVPAADLLPGGPPKDGIPALTDPDFIAAEEVSFLEPNDRVLGVIANGVTKAYPLSIMTRHEIVNDTFDGRPVVVTYCPLCFAGMVFDARIEGRRQTFGVSGLLYNSDVVLYDRETESLWSQLLQQAISGPRRGQALTLLHSTNTTWSDWRERHPGTLVLSDHTGFAVDFGRHTLAQATFACFSRCNFRRWGIPPRSMYSESCWTALPRPTRYRNYSRREDRSLTTGSATRTSGFGMTIIR